MQTVTIMALIALCLNIQEWRIGDRIVAKWGPAGKIYPATISKLPNESKDYIEL